MVDDHSAVKSDSKTCVTASPTHILQQLSLVCHTYDDNAYRSSISSIYGCSLDINVILMFMWTCMLTSFNIIPLILSWAKTVSIKAEERMESIRTLKASISSNFKATQKREKSRNSAADLLLAKQLPASNHSNHSDKQTTNHES